MALNFRNCMPLPVSDTGSPAPMREPMALYRELRRRRSLQPDPGQQLAVEKLQSLYRALLHYQPETGLHGWLARFGFNVNGAFQSPLGLYHCGTVGRGKTMRMDLF